MMLFSYLVFALLALVQVQSLVIDNRNARLFKSIFLTKFQNLQSKLSGLSGSVLQGRNDYSEKEIRRVDPTLLESFPENATSSEAKENSTLTEKSDSTSEFRDENNPTFRQVKSLKFELENSLEFSNNATDFGIDTIDLDKTSSHLKELHNTTTDLKSNKGLEIQPANEINPSTHMSISKNSSANLNSTINQNLDRTVQLLLRGLGEVRHTWLTGWGILLAGVEASLDRTQELVKQQRENVSQMLIPIRKRVGNFARSLQDGISTVGRRFNDREFIRNLAESIMDVNFDREVQEIRNVEKITPSSTVSSLVRLETDHTLEELSEKLGKDCLLTMLCAAGIDDSEMGTFGPWASKTFKEKNSRMEHSEFYRAYRIGQRYKNVNLCGRLFSACELHHKNEKR